MTRIYAYNFDSSLPYQSRSPTSPDASLVMQAIRPDDTIHEQTAQRFSYYDAQDCGWSGLQNSDSSSYHISMQPIDRKISDDHPQGSNYAPDSHYSCEATSVAAVQTPFNISSPVTTTTIIPSQQTFSPHFASMQHSSLPSSTSGTCGQSSSYYYDDPLSYPRVATDPRTTPMDDSHDDVIIGDEEPYYDDGGSPESVWIPEVNHSMGIDGFTYATSSSVLGNAGFDNMAIMDTEPSYTWTKEKQHGYEYEALSPDDARFAYQHFYGEPIHIQDPNYYYPSQGVGSYYPTGMSADMRNTPSDFTSADSPLSPLEFETCHSDASSTDAPLTPLHTISSSSDSTAANLLPIIHAPRPTRTIDPSYFEQLISSSS